MEFFRDEGFTPKGVCFDGIVYPDCGGGICTTEDLYVKNHHPARLIRESLGKEGDEKGATSRLADAFMSFKLLVERGERRLFERSVI